MITSTWRPPDEQVVAFLQEFERRGLDRGADDGNQFADAFVASAPNGSTVLSRAALAATLPQRRRMFDAAGVGAARCVDAAQPDLDDHHLMVTSDWEASRTAGEPVRLASSFLLRRDGGRLQVLAYLNHRDVAAVLAGP